MTSTFKTHFLSKRSYLLVVAHLAVFAFSIWIALGLRYEFAIPAEMTKIFLATLPWILGAKIIVFYLTGHFNGWWRYITFSDLMALGRAATLSFLVWAVAESFLPVSMRLPRSILLIDWGLSMMILGGVRASLRFFREKFHPMVERGERQNALIVGANDTGLALVKQIQHNAKLPFRVIGFIDADRELKGWHVDGIPVMGSLDEIVVVAVENAAEVVLVTAGTIPGRGMRELMEVCDKAGLHLKVIPALDQLLSGQQKIQPRDVDIDDLLHRDPVALDGAAIGTMLKDKVVLVTGAGGSIGSEICRQVLKFSPRKILLVERSENALFNIDRELRPIADLRTRVLPCIADVLDKRRMTQIFESHRPDVVFHAAAHKHVPMMESNPGEAIKNNVLGTRQMADVADRFGVGSFVMISTDKAVHPSNVMGMTKQLAERYIHSMSQSSKTRFVVVRFGNVLGSSGSVVPIFQEQIRRGGPVTVTHPDMERFFMTIPEASQLVLQAGAMSKGGEIFVLDMGEPVKIVDLARDLIRLSGYSVEDIDIEFQGVRPGEKLTEKLYFAAEEMLPTPHPKVSVAYHRPFSLEEVRGMISKLERVALEPDHIIRRQLDDLFEEGELEEPVRSDKMKKEVLSKAGCDTMLPGDFLPPMVDANMDTPFPDSVMDQWIPAVGKGV